MLPLLLPAQPQNAAAAATARVLSLDQCIEQALQGNHRRPASRFEVEMAEAQHRQALAGYWPQVNFKAAFQAMDQPVNFLFPASVIPVPGQTTTVPGGSSLVTIPANAFGPGFPPANVQLPVSYPTQTVNTPAQQFQVPEQNVKVLDRDMATGALDMKWLLFDGGMRKGYREQSGGLVEMMRAEAHRTDLEITDTVTQLYWGGVLARQVYQLGTDTLARMEFTLKLTETLYKGGGGKVSKADYLDNLVMVESLRAMVAQLEKNAAMSQAALANAMGLPWTESVRPASLEIPFDPQAAGLEQLVGASYQFNPDWGKLEAAIRAAEGAVTTAKSGRYPKIALTGDLQRWWNGSFHEGLSTAQNQTSWTAGLGLEIPVFDGMLTRNKVSETLARVHQLQQTQLVLREGLGLQIKDLVMGLDAAAKSLQATSRAMQAATDNRDLYERAYQNELVETEKVIRAQLMEALMSAQHYKARYDYVALRSQLGLVVGTEVGKALTGAAR